VPARLSWHPWPAAEWMPPRRIPCPAWEMAAWLACERRAAAAALVRKLSKAVRLRVAGLPSGGPGVAEGSAGSGVGGGCGGGGGVVPGSGSCETAGHPGGDQYRRGGRASPAICSAPAPDLSALSSPARVAVLFSGGIDSLILARLADLHTPSREPIDLLNVAFGVEAAMAPDRLTGLAGVEELRAVAPTREWRFVEVSR
jgi:hypothetical protein